MTDQKGFTLVEVLVTVILLAVLTLIGYQFIDTSTSVSIRASKHVEAEKDAQVALRVMTQDIRGANPIGASPAGTTCPSGVSFTSTPTAYPNCLRFVVAHSTSGAYCLDSEVGRVAAPYTRHTYGLVGGKVLHDRTEYVPATALGTCTVNSASSYTGRPVIDVVNTASQPLFSYVDRSGTAITAPTAASVVNAGSVRVNLWLKFRNNAPLLELTSVANLRNNRGDRL